MNTTHMHHPISENDSVLNTTDDGSKKIEVISVMRDRDFSSITNAKLRLYISTTLLHQKELEQKLIMKVIPIFPLSR